MRLRLAGKDQGKAIRSTASRHRHLVARKDKAVSEVGAAGNTLLSGVVLLVEDNEFLAEHIYRRLNELGLEVIVAASGEEAIRCYMASAFVAVLMDCEMPVMDGFTASMRIRDYEQRHQLRAVPIFALTGHARSVDQQRCVEAGMNAVLAKPVSRALLSTELRRWLHESMDSAPVLARARLRALG